MPCKKFIYLPIVQAIVASVIKVIASPRIVWNTYPALPDIELPTPIISKKTVVCATET